MLERKYLKLKYVFGEQCGEIKIYLTDIKKVFGVIAWVVNILIVLLILYHDWSGAPLSLGEVIILLVLVALYLAFTFWVGYLVVGFLLHVMIFVLMLFSYIFSGTPLIVEEEISK